MTVSNRRLPKKAFGVLRVLTPERRPKRLQRINQQAHRQQISAAARAEPTDDELAMDLCRPGLPMRLADAARRQESPRGAAGKI